jgi:hypothetical protein
MWQQEDRGPLRQTAATFCKQEGNQRDLLENHRAADIDASRKDFQRVANNHKSNLVDPSEKEEPIRSFGVREAGNVGAPATRDSITPPLDF